MFFSYRLWCRMLADVYDHATFLLLCYLGGLATGIMLYFMFGGYGD